jgi:hypothetical protein
MKTYKSLKKEIAVVIKRWQNIPCSWISRISAVKMAIVPKAIYRFNDISIPMPFILFFFRNRKINPKLHLKAQNIPNGQTILI